MDTILEAANAERRKILGELPKTEGKEDINFSNLTEEEKDKFQKMLQDRERAYGRALPHKFIQYMTDLATATLEDWLIRVGAPEPIKDLYGHIYTFTRWAANIGTDEFDDFDATNMPNELLDLIEIPAELGGDYGSSEDIHPNFGPHLKLKGAKNGK